MVRTPWAAAGTRTIGRRTGLAASAWSSRLAEAGGAGSTGEAERRLSTDGTGVGTAAGPPWPGTGCGPTASPTGRAAGAPVGLAATGDEAAEDPTGPEPAVGKDVGKDVDEDEARTAGSA